MRLSTSDQSIAKEVFGDVQMRLYGSRIYDDLKGDGIDLLLEYSSIIDEKERQLLQICYLRNRLMHENMTDNSMCANNFARG